MTSGKRHIGDPLERAATTGKIGSHNLGSLPTDIQTPEHPNAQNSESSEVQQSEHPSIQNSGSPDVQTSKHPNSQTPRNSDAQPSLPSAGKNEERRASPSSPHRGREQQTIYLPPHLVRKLKIHKALHDKEYSDIVAEALEEYFHLHPE